MAKETKRLRCPVYRASGQIENRYPRNARKFQKDELQEVVHGVPQILTLGSTPDVMVCACEEGSMQVSDINERATMIWKGCGETGVIRGDVLICPLDMIEL